MRIALQAPRYKTRYAGVRTRRNTHGYILILLPEHHLADVNGEVYEHRLVAEETLGRRLRKGEVVHHKNGVKDDNHPDNLMVFASHSEHVRYERSQCKRGHDLTEENVVMRRDGRGKHFRQCIICERAKNRYYAAKRSARKKLAKEAA